MRIHMVMKPDSVYVTRAALGLYHVQAIQAPSAHIVMYWVCLRCKMPLRLLGEQEDLLSLAVVDEVDCALVARPACVGARRPHT